MAFYNPYAHVGGINLNRYRPHLPNDIIYGYPFYQQPFHTRTEYVVREQQPKQPTAGAESFFFIFLVVTFVSLTIALVFNEKKPQRRQEDPPNRQEHSSDAGTHLRGRFHVPAKDGGVPPAKPYIYDDLDDIQFDSQISQV